MTILIHVALGLAIGGLLALLIRQRHDAAMRLRLALDATRMGLFDWDLLTRRIRWSGHHERLWGYAPGTFDGTYAMFASRVHPEDLPGVESAINRCKLKRTRFAHEFRVLWPDGSLHWIESLGDFVFDPGGRAIRMHGTVMEITERKQAELQLSCHQHIVDNCGEMLTFVDRDLRYQVANPAYAALHNTTPEALRGRLLPEIVGPGTHARIAVHLGACLAGAPRQFIDQRPIPGGFQYLEVNYHPFRYLDGTVRGIVISLHDITELTETRAALEAYQAHLEALVAMRTAEARTLGERLRLATEAGGIGVWEWEVASDQLIWDAGTRALYGWPEQAADPGYADWMARIHREDRPRLHAILQRIARGDATVLRETFQIRWPDGTPRYLASSGTVIQDAREHRPRLLGVHWDVTEQTAARLALETSKARAKAIIDAAPVPFALNDAGHRVVYLNPAFVATFGYTINDIPTLETWAERAYPDPDYRAWVTDTWRTHLERTRRDGVPFEPLELTIRCQDGATRTVMARAALLNYDVAGGHLVTLVDVTELQQARDQAQQAARDKAAFLANMSHEIRTPMNGLIGLSELALHQPLAPVARDYLDKIHQSASSLLRILNDILDYSKIEAGRLTLEHAPFDRNAVLDTLRALFGQVAALKALALRFEIDPAAPRYLIGDALRLQQVLSNLLGNAIKFTDRGQVRLGLAVLSAGGARVRLRWSVADTGIGMDEAALARLFQPFTQADDSIARRFGGTGLGLAISQDLLELMDSGLEVTSAPGQGTTFAFDLTLEVPDPAVFIPPAELPAAAHRQSLAGTRVLVAEDHPINQRVIRDMLRLLGVQVTLASDGGEALERLAEAPFDALLTDIQMPGMDGLTATRWIRDNPAWADLPVIALTAGVTDAERARITASGMTDLLAKPVTLDSLSATLRRWIRGPALPDAHATASPPGAAPSSSARDADLLNLPGFDLPALAETMGGADWLIPLLHEFASAIRIGIAELAGTLAAGELAEANHILHRLKGLVGNFRALDLQAAILTLEADLQSGQDPAPALETLRQAERAALAAIDGLPTAST